MLRKLLAPLTLAIAMLAAPAANAAEEEPQSALEAFKASHEAILSLIHAGAGDAVYEKIVDGRLDYKWISEASLGGPRKYEAKCQPRCDEYQELLTEVIRGNYLRLVKDAKDHPVEYLGEEVRKKATKVDTKIKVLKNGREQELKVSYVMHKIDDHWYVRDIITDGVSLAKTYRYDFGKILKRGGIDELILRLTAKRDEIAAADTGEPARE